MDLLAYWRIENYKRDLDEGAGFHFNSKQSRLHTAINLGESLWLFTRFVGPSGHSEYRIVARLVIRSKTINPPSYKYGPFRVWGDLKLSQYFQINNDPTTDAFELLRILPLDSGTFAKCNRSTIGQSAQTLRCLKPEASRLLESFCGQIAVEDRARAVADEVELEKALEGSPSDVESLLQETPLAYSATRRAELISSYPRNRQIVSKLQSLYAGRCQLCAFDSPTVYAVDSAESHHIIYRSRGGPDVFDNLVLLCPNHHTVVHGTNATFDYSRLAFLFPNGRTEPLCLNKHLESRSIVGMTNSK